MGTNHVQNLTNAYDPSGNITSITDNLASSRTQTLGYDNLNRLNSASGLYGSQSYTYDGVGNRLTRVIGSTTDTYAYSSTANQISTVTTGSNVRSFTYAASGQVTQDVRDPSDTDTFTYNDNGRSVTAKLNGSTVGSYTYNAFEQRVQKVEANGVVVPINNISLSSINLSDVTLNSGSMTSACHAGQTMTDSRRIIELDGLRGVAALIVVVSHYFGEVAHGSRLVTFGWLGVEIFFVLSGFLIGSIILENHAKSNFFGTFYLRRAARIFPIYALTCIATLCLAAATSGHIWSDHPYSSPVYAIFGTNIAMSLIGGGGTWLRPTWTLDVEEQFYLLLPLLIFFTPRRLLPWLLAALWLLATAFRSYFTPANPEAALSLLPCRMDLLLGGVLIALISRQFDASRYLTVLRIIPLASMIALVAISALSPFGLFLILGSAIASIGIASFLLAIINGAPEGARYRSPVLRYFGQISYALYLVHQPVAGVLHGVLLNSAPDIGTFAQLGVTILAIAVSIAIATASWRWLESPILTWARRHKFGVGIPATEPHSV